MPITSEFRAFPVRVFPVRVYVCVCVCVQSALEGHSGAVTSVVLTGGGRFAVTAGEDATAIVWDLGVKGHSAHPQQHGHKSKVLSVSYLRQYQCRLCT